MNQQPPSSSKWLPLIVLSLTLFCVVFLMGMGIVSFYHSRSVRATPAAVALAANGESIPTVLFAFDRPVAAWIEDPQGTVEVIGSDTTEWQETVSTPMALMVGQRVRTGPRSGVVLRFSDGRQARLEAGTEVSFHAVEESLPVLILHHGQAVYGVAARE